MSYNSPNRIKPGIYKTSGYEIVPPIDKEIFTEIEGLEGPFRLQSGLVVYYDPAVGQYYDRRTDMYLTNEDYAMHNTPRQWKGKKADHLQIEETPEAFAYEERQGVPTSEQEELDSLKNHRDSLQRQQAMLENRLENLSLYRSQGSDFRELENQISNLDREIAEVGIEISNLENFIQRGMRPTQQQLPLAAKTASYFGFHCPQCKAPVKMREKRSNGNDICENGHKYPSKESVKK
jgi:hypothetical protein